MAFPIIDLALITLAFAFLLGLGGFAFISLREKEPRAARVSAAISCAGFLTFTFALWLPAPVKIGILALVLLASLTGLVAFFLPIGRAGLSQSTPTRRFDERDIMFARARLIPGSPQYQSYYAMRPENLPGDELTRSKPGLLSLKAAFANPYLFASSQGSFVLTEALHAAVDGPVAPEKHSLDPPEMTAFIKNLGRYYGALEIGVTELKPYHVYSHIGRGSGVYGAPLPIEHRYAIAFTVEMDFEMIGANPTAPGVMESAREYVEAARVAVQLAATIRHLGYPARAHMDGDYRVIAPLVGRDAGLGEIGRMGLLMTPRQGPRVRINVVTTDLDLIPDPPCHETSVIDFCRVCKKCAVNCPVKAIPFDDRQEIEGALRWRINADTCFRYWNVVGTDCGRCMTVCPFSHPDSFYHNLVRWGIDRSGAFRRLALWLDDLFYGKQPIPRQAPPWARMGEIA